MIEIEKSIKKPTNRVVSRLILLLCLLLVSVPANSSDEQVDAEDEDTVAEENEAADAVETRGKIIDLIEHDLAEAYSFTESSTHRLPHFEIIDRIFPKWHHGNAAGARQFWVSAAYRMFVVLFRVDYVYLMNDAAARVEGKRLVIWSQNEEGTDFGKFWPFQLWAAVGKRTQRDNSYLEAAYTMRYQMKLALNEKGEWVVVEETQRDNPEMVNNIKNPCLYEKQLADWGLKNDCNKKLLPL
jgi:hypothetical protein